MEDWAHFIGEIVGTALIVFFGLLHRKSQNKQLNHTIATVLAHQVDKIDQQVVQIREQVAVLKEVVSNHKDELHRVSDREMTIISRIGALEDSLPKLEDLLTKTLSFFSRGKAEPLESKPLPGGKVLIKTRKD